MKDTKTLTDLVEEWQKQAQGGKEVSLESLCQSCPELLGPLQEKIEEIRTRNELSATVQITPDRADTAVNADVSDKMRSAPAPLPTVPGYTILRELGRGGMGVVYLARQAGLERLVAIKMLPQGSEAESTLSRFRTEAEALARLQHSNLIQIYEVGNHNGRPFFSMEFVGDGSLDEHLGGRPQPPREAALLVQVLAQAMHEAHRSGIVHRDLKPGNILLKKESSKGEGSGGESGVWISSAPESPGAFAPKITDFGLAKRLDSAEGMTMSQSILGTPSYMAPEQARGESKHVSAATDTYALGVILYELLTGRPPFQGDTPYATIQLVIGTDPVSPRALQPTVPRDLEVICLKCLEKNPSRRYGQVIELAEDLRRFLAGEPIHARPTGRIERLAKWARRRPGAAVAVAVGVLSLATLLVVGTFFHLQLQRALLTEQASVRESRQRLVQLEVAQGNNALDHGEGPLAMLWFADALRLDDPANERPHRLRLGMVGQSSPGLRQIWFSDNVVRKSTFDSTGSRAVTVGDDGAARIWKVDTGEQARNPLLHPGAVVDAAVDKSGRLLVTACIDGNGRIWDIASGKVVALLKHGGALTGARFSPDGRQVLTASNDGTARLWSSEGKPLAILKHEGPVVHGEFGTSGRLVVTASADGTARVWETEHGKPVTLPLRHDKRVTQATLSPDDKFVATAGYDSTARIWAVQSTSPAPVILRHFSPVKCVTFNRDGSRLASGSDDGIIYIWDPASGKRVLPGLRHTSGILVLAYHPDGSTLVSGGDDNSARCWDTVTGEPLTAPFNHGGNVLSVAIDASGKSILTGSSDGTARLWDMAPAGGKPTIQKRPISRTMHPDNAKKTWWNADRSMQVVAEGSHLAQIRTAGGEPVGAPLQHGSLVVFAAFSPDGKRLVTTSEDCTARIWDVATGNLLARPLQQQGTIGFAAFSPDSRSYVVTASTDNTARVWNAESGELVTPPLRFSGSLAGAGFPQDSRVQVRSMTDTEEWTFEWPLVSETRPAPLLLREAEILSSSRIDPARGLMPLEIGNLRQAWNQARGVQQPSAGH